MVNQKENTVLILLLVEYSLGLFARCLPVPRDCVLILLLVEYGLGYNLRYRQVQHRGVLILLMMKSRQQPRYKDTTNPATQQPQH